MELRVQRVLIWAGPAMLVLWLGAFVFIAGFIPPSAPSDTAADVLARYARDHVGIKIGMVIAMFGSALLVPWAVAISGQLKRIDGAKALADVAMLILPAGVVLFFKTGPFAWNGIVGIYIPLVGYAVWMIATTIAVDRALVRQIAAAAS